MDYYFCYMKPVEELHAKIVNESTKDIYNVHFHKPKFSSYPANLYAKIKRDTIKVLGNSTLYIPVSNDDVTTKYAKFIINFDAIYCSLSADKKYVTLALNFMQDKTMLSIYMSDMTTYEGWHNKYIYIWSDKLNDYIKQRISADNLSKAVKVLYAENEYSNVAAKYLKCNI